MAIKKQVEVAVFSGVHFQAVKQPLVKALMCIRGVMHIKRGASVRVDPPSKTLMCLGPISVINNVAVPRRSPLSAL